MFILIACAAETHPVRKLREQLPEGTLRGEAIELIQDEIQPWYHQVCIRGSSTHDLFFYGSRKYDEAEAIVVISIEVEGGQLRIFPVAATEQGDWKASYRDCVDSNRFRR